jgi:protein ImuB
VSPKPDPADLATRTVVVWCADWPIVAAGIDGRTEAAAVLHANRVVACSEAARAEGVRRGLRRREAQGRCPDLTVLATDVDRDARTFEAVAAAVEVMTPRVEIVRPGVLAFPARAPHRYFGGDEPVVARIAELVDPVVAGRGRVGIGIADGAFAALLAARRDGGSTAIVAPGASAASLAPLPSSVLELARPDDPAMAELTDLLVRLGLRTLGAVAELPPGRMVERFGPLGALASRLARGLDERPPQPREVPPDLVVQTELDPPTDRVETATFVARALAIELGERLGARGLTCTRLSIEVVTEHDEELARLWRHEGGLGAAAIADRCRWQLDGWLGPGVDHGRRPTGAIAHLRLVPDQVVADTGRQLGFWGGARETDERAGRCVARIQGLLGPDAVLVPERRGGRGPGEQVGLVPAHGVRLGTAVAADDADLPWPGRVPAPSPALVAPSDAPASSVDLVDAEGAAVGVTGRGELRGDAAPARLGGVDVVAWAGPWPCEERWWDPDAARRRARVQVVLATGEAHLLVLEGGRWRVEATYD